MLPEAVMRVAEIQNDWDYVLVGDGSGSRRGYPGGWGVIVFDKLHATRKLLMGSVSDTTVNIAELVPYIFAMDWIVKGPNKEDDKLQIARGELIIVDIVTDCKIIAQQGNREAERKANAAFWAALDHYKRYGFKYRFHWVDRDLFAANRVCDFVSKQVRGVIKRINAETDVLHLPDLYDDSFGEPKEDVTD